MNTRKQKILFLLFAAVTFSVCATTNYWDNNGDTVGFGTAGGTWGVDANWSIDSTGESIPGTTDTTSADDLFFGYGTNGLAAGTVAVDSTNQSFRSMTFGAASGSIILSNGTVTLAAPYSEIRVDNEIDTIATELTGTNGLSKVYPVPVTYYSYLTTTSTTLFYNASLSDYRSAGAIMNGSSIARRPADAYHFSNDGSTATCQFQDYDDGYTKFVKVELTQSGTNILGRAIYAKYVNGNQLGFDFDNGGNNSGVATSATSSGYGVERTILLPMTEHYEPFLTTSPVTVLADVTLSSLTTISASMGGSSVSDSPFPTTPLFFKNNGTTATVQFQAYNGGYTKCVKVELAQSGADITARALYAKYINKQNNNLVGTDFDGPGTTASGIATSFGTGNYGLCQLRFEDSILRLAGVNSWTGGTVIEGGTLELADAGQLGTGSYSGTIANNGRLLYNSTANQTLSGAISGSGNLIKASPGKSVSSLTYPSTLGDSFSDIFYNVSLSDCIGAEGVLGGASINGGTPLPATTYFFTNDGVNASCQFQVYDGGHTKCAKVAFTQNGPNIAARRVYAKYLLSQNSLGFDFDTGGSIGGYLVVQTTVDLLRHSILKISGSNSYAGGTVVEKGTLEVNGTTSSLPTTGGIVVNEDAELLLNVPGDPGIYGSVGGNNPIYVRGGLLTINGKFNAGHQRPITVDGGVLNSTVTANNDNSNYMNNLWLMNGASVTGYKIRVGYVSVPTITVSGTNACSIPAGINMVKNGTNPLTLNVADVTGDETADLTISGVIRDYDAGLSGMPLVKNGAGTVSISGANTHVGLITVSQGTLALEGNDSLNTGNTVVLNGGALDMGSVDNTVGTLTVGASGGTLALGAGTLSFADSSAVSWSGTLTLTGALIEKTVRFGTDNTGLTTDQLNAIDYAEGKVRIDKHGYLTLRPQGTIILVQ